jgi:hypothetical protein
MSGEHGDTHTLGVNLSVNGRILSTSHLHLYWDVTLLLHALVWVMGQAWVMW